MQCSFTIRVGEKQPEGVRDVSVLHRGEVHFATSHNNVKWAFLTRFPAPPHEATESTAIPPDDTFDESGIDRTLLTSGGDRVTSAGVTPLPGVKVLQEYLCVFHRDDPKNRRSHYAVCQPSTICSAYSTLHPAAVTHFVLLNISPTSVVPALRGVFVHGNRQSSRWAVPQLLRIDGFTFQPAADLWWMATPLSAKPVYVPLGGAVMDLAPNAVATMANQLPSNPSNGSAGSKYALLDATVVAQFQAYEGRTMAFAVSGDEVGLAATAIVEQFDLLVWMWWPQRLRLPHLHVKGASVSVTVSENPHSVVQCLFLFDASRNSLHLLRTPDLRTGKGDLTLLFTISTNCPPVVLPCLRPAMVQPVMVCHQSGVNEVTLYHVPTLLRDPSPSSAIASMPLAASLPRNALIDGVLYQEHSSVAFLASVRLDGTDVADNTAMDNADSGISRGNTTSCSVTCSSSSSSSTGGGRHPVVVGFPSLLEDQHPLAHFILESLEPVLDTDLVASLQCELLRRAWESRRIGCEWDFSGGLLELIVDIICMSLTGGRSNKKNNNDATNKNINNNTGYEMDEDTTEITVTTNRRAVLKGASSDAMLGDGVRRKVRLYDTVMDPFLLTVDLLQRDSPPREYCMDECGVAQLWTLHQCGLSVLVLHLLCESFKLQERLWPLLEPLAQLNLRLAQALGWEQYVRYYATCLCVPKASETLWQRPNTSFQRAMPEHVLFSRFEFHAESSSSAVVAGEPPVLYTILQRVLAGKARASGGWPSIKCINPSNPLSVTNRLFCLLVDCFDAPRAIHDLSSWWWLILCKGLIKYSIDPKFVHLELCVGVAQPIRQALAIARDHPEDTWDDDFNIIIGRLDRLRRPTPVAPRDATPAGDVVRAAEERAVGRQYRATLNDDDGVILRPDFPRHWGDSRLDMVQTMLNTAAPIALPGRVVGTDAIYAALKTLSRRATALSVGRGMFTLCTQNFRVRDSVPIPRLNLEGRTSDGITIAKNSDETSTECLLWPIFHNGCAAGLRFLPLPHFDGHEPLKQEQSITRHWVLYQTRNITCPASRSGLLLAAGLLGHLKVLQRTDIYSLLVSPLSQYSGREVVTIAVMLGLSCSFRGSCNGIVFNCLSMHVQSLTPATEDIEVSLDVQTAALISIGILHQRSPDAFLVEMLLIQMSRLPSDEHFRDREGYALGAGFGLGLLLLGFGGSHGIANIENRLIKFMEAARREAVPSACEGLETFNELNPDNGHFLTRGLLARNAKDSFKSYCTRVYEGDRFNIAVSSPAAVIALGFMYMQTDDHSMSSKVSPPDRLVGLQGVYPELCLLRSMMSSLIMWGSIEPTKEWLRKSVPSCLLRLAKSSKFSGLAPAQVRYLMMNLGHCLAGAVLALGMRFAGSMDADAKGVIIAELNGFLRGNIGTTATPISAIQRSTGAFQTCISACAVALSIVMAGTGDAQCFAVIQKLHRRTNVKYGDHLAVSMATGLLFLGGGQLTLSNSLSSVAALVMAFYPIWPETTCDNKIHLQALRQLYCLAVVPRVIETVDVLTNRSVSVPIRVIVHRGRLGQSESSSVVKKLWTPLPKGKENQAVRMVTPCLLPDPSTISRIEIRSAQHYNLTIHNSSSTTIGDGGLVVRVLEKHVTSTDPSKSAWSRGEQLVVNWIQRLFHEQPQQRPRCIEATVILDNVNMLFTSQDSFISNSAPSESEFSPDFVLNVRRTLERRYHALLQRCGRLSPQHPLTQIIMVQQSVYTAAMSLIKSITTSAGDYPTDLTEIAASLHAYVGATGKDGSIPIAVAMAWLSQALHFYGLAGGTLAVPQLLNTCAPALERHGQRFTALYHMNQELLLRPQVLEDLVNCCVEYID